MSVCGADLEAVDVPTCLTERCELLRDLREEADSSNIDLPVPFSKAELKAWVQCALYSESEQASQGHQDREADEDTLLKALKVR